jgi:Lon protease-like protein
MDDDCVAGGACEALSDIPLFPLPNVVLFPRAVLPLHIFEERYKAMVADALEGDRQIAMALLRPGWETNYYGRAALEPVVCVGTILNHERLADGRYNLLLQGHTRATLVEEAACPTPSYRRARLAVLRESPVMEIDLSNERVRLTSIFSEEPFAGLPLAQRFSQMLSSTIPTSDVADLAAFHLLENICLKQKLLAEPDPRCRVRKVVGALEALRPLLHEPRGRFGSRTSCN